MWRDFIVFPDDINFAIINNVIYNWLGGLARNGYHGMGLYPRTSEELQTLGKGNANDQKIWARQRLANVTNPDTTILIGDGRDKANGSAGPGMQLGMLQWTNWKNGYYMKGNCHRNGMFGKDSRMPDLSIHKVN